MCEVVHVLGEDEERGGGGEVRVGVDDGVRGHDGDVTHHDAGEVGEDVRVDWEGGGGNEGVRAEGPDVVGLRVEF